MEQKPSGKINLDDHNLDDMARSLKGPGVYVVSMKDIFSAVTPVVSYFSDFSHHLTPAGHEIMARDLADLIGSRLALKTAAPGEGRGENPGNRRQNYGLAATRMENGATGQDWRHIRAMRLLVDLPGTKGMTWTSPPQDRTSGRPTMVSGV